MGSKSYKVAFELGAEEVKYNFQKALTSGGNALHEREALYLRLLPRTTRTAQLPPKDGRLQGEGRTRVLSMHTSLFLVVLRSVSTGSSFLIIIVLTDQNYYYALF